MKTQTIKDQFATAQEVKIENSAVAVYSAKEANEKIFYKGDVKDGSAFGKEIKYTAIFATEQGAEAYKGKNADAVIVWSGKSSDLTFKQKYVSTKYERINKPHR